jgi:pullulanase
MDENMDKTKVAEYYNTFTSNEFAERYLYEGEDLGAFWTKESTRFRLWAPTAEGVILNLYRNGNASEHLSGAGLYGSMIADGEANTQDLIVQYPMLPDEQGTWFLEVNGDLNGVYYTYSVTVEGSTREAVDPYAKAAGVNGDRGMVINLTATDPEGFREERRPDSIKPTDAIIYEIHVRDFSVDVDSGMKNKGKFLAFTEENTVNSHGDKTGISHLKELGITHVHLLPVFDYATVEEAESQYNWGYDPKNYNVPEGSYSIDPFHGDVRIREFKQMIQTLHTKGIRVIMDVVYNHTYSLEDSNLQKCVPGYYYRMTPKGVYSDASACGNETASERPMVRKYITDSVVYWAKEYHIDGFRFDLMGVHDIDTMNRIRTALDQIDPGILIYGEGWTGGASPLPEELRAMKANMKKLHERIAAFSDDIRDGIKGSVFEEAGQGFVNGGEGMEETIKFGITAAVIHDQVDYKRVNYSDQPWAKAPSQTVNYASAHDNLTLWDKLALSAPESSREDRLRMNLLSAAIVLTSQGIPFFQAGEELLRSKPLNGEGSRFDDNSYRSPDAVNSIKWEYKTRNLEVFRYYRGLIALRKAYTCFRYAEAGRIQSSLRFIDTGHPKLIAYLLEQHSGCPKEEPKNTGNQELTICVVLNANREAKTIELPEGVWNVYVKGKRAGTEVLEIITDGTVTTEPISALVLVKE